MSKPTLNIVLVEPRIPLHCLPAASGRPHGLCHR